MLPDLDGLDVCREIRRHSDVPVIMVTARADSRHVVAGLEAGADNYVTKPVVAQELTLRIRALLRRSRRDQLPARIEIGDIELVPAEATVRRGDQDLHLTKTEFRLLCELASRPGTVLTREQLLERVWAYDTAGARRPWRSWRPSSRSIQIRSHEPRLPGRVGVILRDIGAPATNNGVVLSFVGGG